MKKNITRRKFVKTGLAATAGIALVPFSIPDAAKSPYDPKGLPTRPLGNTGLKVPLLLAFAFSLMPELFSQQSDYRPGLFFREDWKEIPAEIPVSQEHVANPDLILHLYGPAKDVIKKSHHDKPVDDPYYIWSGLCEDNWLVTLEHRDKLIDLTGFAKIRWRAKQAGFRELHIVLKLEDGTWLASKESDGPSKDWRIKEFNIQDLNWYELNIETICETNPVSNPDLSKVKEIGFTDLMRGGGSNACSRVDWIEVYGE
jgi:hypothetical protein